VVAGLNAICETDTLGTSIGVVTQGGPLRRIVVIFVPLSLIVFMVAARSPFGVRTIHSEPVAGADSL